MGRSTEEELRYTTELIAQDFSNYSAWHYRTILLPKLYGEEIRTGRVVWYCSCMGEEGLGGGGVWFWSLGGREGGGEGERGRGGKECRWGLMGRGELVAGRGEGKKGGGEGGS